MTRGNFPADFKPMLAFTPKKWEIKFPVIASYKIDGFRCLFDHHSVAHSRALKPFANVHINDHFANLKAEKRSYLQGLDGELMTYNADGWMKPLREVSSDITSADGTPHFIYWVFDVWDKPENYTYSERLGSAALAVNLINDPRVCYLETKLIHSMDELLAYEDEALAAGFEGIMFRDPVGLYKQGRSTEKEGGLGKVKRFRDATAEILEVVEEQANLNAAETDFLGRTKRSSAQAGKVGKDRAGSLYVRACIDGREYRFYVASGLDDHHKVKLWADRQKINGGGTFVDVKFREIAKDSPTLTTFRGLRPDIERLEAA